VILPLDKPLKSSGHLEIMYGNLAPEGSVGKITGKEGLSFEGPALVFDGEEAMLAALAADPPSFKVSPMSTTMSAPIVVLCRDGVLSLKLVHCPELCSLPSWCSVLVVFSPSRSPVVQTLCSLLGASSYGVSSSKGMSIFVSRQTSPRRCLKGNGEPHLQRFLFFRSTHTGAPLLPHPCCSGPRQQCACWSPCR
jgi:Dehydratase family